MFRLYYANQLEVLIEPLGDQIRQQDPFLTKTLIVPNRNLQAWLNIQLAERLGFCGNIRYRRLDPAFADILAGERTELLSDTVLQMMMIRLMTAYRADDDPETAPFRTYLGEGGDARVQPRMFQLARELVAIFREYAFSREEMVRIWLQNGAYFGPDRPLEVWQRRLWRDLFGEKGMLARRNRVEDRTRLTTLTELDPTNVVLKEPLFLFGVSYISRFHQRVLSQLSRVGEVHLFVLNPCRMFWEDVRDLGEERALRRSITKRAEMHGELDEDEENPFLRAWGKPGREYTRLLNDAAQWDFEDLFEAPTEQRQGLLQHLQASILDRRPEPASGPLAQPDPSFRILGCPSPRREAEIVANSIWDLLLEEPSLDLRDIAVMVTDMGAYQSEIESAFQRIHAIPYNLVDGRTGRAARLIDAALLLLALPESRFNRESVFQLYRHPNFRARFPNADPDAWLRMADELSIFYGKNFKNQREQGVSYFENDLYNWDQGLKRLVLGGYIHRDENPIFRSETGEYLVYPIPQSELDEAHLFFAVTQSLLADTGDLARRELPASVWAACFRGLITTYLAPGDYEDQEFDRIRAAAAQVEELAQAFEDEQEPIPFAIAKSFMLQELKKLAPYYGQYLADGVTVSSFMPMRPIPFKAIFVMGLDENRFPSPIKKKNLDLRWSPRTVTGSDGRRFEKTREIGDVASDERDRYMFLETLISARERLVLSYTDRNELTDDPINYSSVLAELLFRMDRFCPGFEIERHPLKSYSERYRFGEDDSGKLMNHDPIAARLARARAQRTALPESLKTCSVEDLARELDPASRDALGLISPYQGMKATTLDPGESALRLTMSQLRAFLECPLQASARRALRLEEDQEDLIEKNDEPFSPEKLVRWKQLDRVMETVLGEHEGGYEELPELTMILDQILHEAELRGLLPSGPLFQVTRDGMIAAVRAWINGIRCLGIKGQGERRFLGKSVGPRRPHAVLPPIRFELEIQGVSRPVEIIGRTEYIFTDMAEHHTLCFREKILKPKREWDRYLLKGFLDSVAMAARGVTETMTSAIVGLGDQPPYMVHYKISEEQALAYLKELVLDMLSRAHDYLLPVDSVFKLKDQFDKPDFQDRYELQISKLVESSEPRSSSMYGPVREWREYPPAADAQAAIQRRFGLLFDNLRVSGWSNVNAGVRG